MNKEKIMENFMEVSEMIKNSKQLGPRPDDDKHRGPRPIDDRHLGSHPDDKHLGPHPDDKHFGPRPDGRPLDHKEKKVLLELLNYDKIDQIVLSKELDIMPQETMTILQGLERRMLIQHKREIESNEVFIFLTLKGINEANSFKAKMTEISNEFFKCLNEEQLKELDNILNILMTNN